MFTKYNDTVFNGIKIKNILDRYLLISETIGKKQTIFQDYLIIDWESPETVAYKVYGSCDYHWAVLLANNVINPFYDWLLKEDEIRYYIEKKYGNKAFEPHHWELYGLAYPYDVEGATMVSNYQYEFDLNEKKRKIRVIIPSYVETILTAITKKSMG